MRGAAEWDGPMVLHVLTQKGRGYAPAEEDDLQRLHDFKVAPTPINADDSSERVRITTYTDAFSRALVREAERDDRIVALTAAMPGPTGLLPFQATFGERFIDVGIAEQHEMTSAAGMAMGGMKPVVCVYSTFFARAFDQAYYDVGMHQLPVTVVLDRAGITGDDGASHHGVLDMALCLTIPNMTHPDAPVGALPTDNKVIRKWGEPRHFSFKPKDHLALAEALDLVDFESGARVAGQKFYFLKNEAVLLEMALIQFALQTMIKP
jgi:deoxyxylulose-5-phosphate synthase